jgi:hypothetical protein
VGGLFSIPKAGGTLWQWQGNVEAWSPVVDSQDRAWVGDDDSKLHRLAVRSSGTPTTVETDGVSNAAPLLGEGGHVYLATHTGTIEARRAESIELDWRLPNLGTFGASPNIDCSRDDVGKSRRGAPGVLYVANGSGEVYSILVDSRGIDVSAPWPKYQHDPRNSGNAGTSLADFNCQ